jgi:hypothetical protein
MTTSTCWPRIGPATYRATTQEDGLRREAIAGRRASHGHLRRWRKLALGTLSRWRHGFKSRWDYQETRRSGAMSGARGPSRFVLVPHLSRGRCERVESHPDSIHRWASAAASNYTGVSRDTQQSRPRSSPWIRTQPQRGFSRAKRRISSLTSAASGGRPVPLARNVHLRLTSWRCQRSRVEGPTRNELRRSRGSTRATAASRTRSSRRSLGRPVLRESTFS